MMLSKNTVDVWSDTGQLVDVTLLRNNKTHIEYFFFTWKSMMSRKCSRSWVFVVFLLADGLTVMGNDGG